MKLIELQNQIKKHSEEVKTNYLGEFKILLTNLINKILKENNVEGLWATFDYDERMNLVKIVVRDSNKKFWPIMIEYKTTRKTIKEHWNGNLYEYTLKEVSIWNCGERKISADKEIKIETTEDYLKAELYSNEVQKNKIEEEKNKLKEFMKDNPEFLTMVDYYNKYKYQLN